MQGGNPAPTLAKPGNNWWLSYAEHHPSPNSNFTASSPPCSNSPLTRGPSSHPQNKRAPTGSGTQACGHPTAPSSISPGHWTSSSSRMGTCPPPPKKRCYKRSSENTWRLRRPHWPANGTASRTVALPTFPRQARPTSATLAPHKHHHQPHPAPAPPAAAIAAPAQVTAPATPVQPRPPPRPTTPLKQSPTHTPQRLSVANRPCLIGRERPASPPTQVHHLSEPAHLPSRTVPPSIVNHHGPHHRSQQRRPKPPGMETLALATQTSLRQTTRGQHPSKTNLARPVRKVRSGPLARTLE